MIVAPVAASAHSVRHHIYDMGRSLVRIVTSPLEGAVIQGPKNIRKTWEYEVWGREETEKRGQLRYRLFALWRVPGDEMKGIIDGVVKSVDSAGVFLKEFLSIIFSD